MPIRTSERAERWRVRLGDAFSDLAPEPLPGGGHVDGYLAGRLLGDLATFQVDGSPQVVRRTRAAVRAVPTDLYKVCVQVRGRATIHQDGREVVLESGQMAIYDTGRPYDLRLEDDWSCAVLAFRRTALSLPERVLARSMDHVHPLTAGPGAVLDAFVRSAVTQPQVGAAAAERLGEAGLHLIAGTLSEIGTAPGDADGPALDDARRLTVLGYVRTHLTERSLSHARVAAVHHMSGRTLHRLFDGEPFTVTDYIRTRRLEAIRRDLADPLLAHHTIAALAGRWGFPDNAHFTRAYRAHFGETPSRARRVAG